MRSLTWQEPPASQINSLINAVTPIVAPLTLEADKTQIRYLDLPFYEDYKLYGLFPQDKPGALFGLCKADDINMLNGTNEAIYRVNEKAPIRLNPKNVASYATFFFDFVRGRHGHFIIIEKAEEVPWLPNTAEADKARVNDVIHPLKYTGIGRDNRFNLEAKVLFKNALFKTTIRVAADGLIELTDEDLVFEDLPVLTEEIIADAMSRQNGTQSTDSIH